MGGENGELFFDGSRGSVLQEKNVLWTDGGDGCTVMRGYMALLNSILQNG